MDPAKMKVVDLRSELGALGLDTKGNKPALVERLKKALEAKTGKLIADTSILDTTTEDVEDTPKRPGPAARTRRRSSSVRLAATPAKQPRRESPEAIIAEVNEEDRYSPGGVSSDEQEVERPKTPPHQKSPERESSPEPEPKKSPESSPVREQAPVEKSPALKTPEKKVEVEEESTTPVSAKEDTAGGDVAEPMEAQDSVEAPKEEEAAKDSQPQTMEQDGETEKPEGEKRERKSRFESRELTEEEEWDLLNERLQQKEKERIEREKKQAEDDAKKLEEFSNDPIRLKRLQRKHEKKQRWNNYYRNIEVTNEILTPPNEEDYAVWQKQGKGKPAAQTETKVNVEPELDDSKVTLSWYDSDLNQYLVLPGLNEVMPLAEGAFAHAWAGARATHGVASGRVCYEVKIGSVVSTTEAGDKDPITSALRIGWSTDDQSLHLGEGERSWAYESTGRAVCNSEFKEYGKELNEKDVIGAYVDLESSPCKILYTLNGIELGTAYEFEKSALDGKALFPHILTKNICYKVNMGYDRYNMLTKTKIVRNRIEIPVEQILEEKRIREEELQRQKEEALRREKERKEKEKQEREERQRKKREEREKAEKEKKEKELAEKKARGEDVDEDMEKDTDKDPKENGDKTTDSLTTDTVEVKEEPMDAEPESEAPPPPPPAPPAPVDNAPEISDVTLSVPALPVDEAPPEVKEEEPSESTEVPEVTEDQVLKGHVLDKRIKFVIRYTADEELDGTEACLLPGYVLIAHGALVPGPRRPATVADCEVILMIGMPGAGKSHWVRQHVSERPDKRYNILSTGSLFDKMRVDCKPLKATYEGRWDTMVSKCAKCVLKLLEMAHGRRRNFVLDQTNVYPSAQRRKLREFDGYRRVAVPVITDDDTYKERCQQRETADGKEVPDPAILDMKANFSLPEKGAWLDEVIYPDLDEEEAKKIVEGYHKEAKAAGVMREREKRDRSAGRDAPAAKRQRSLDKRYGRDDRGRSRDYNRGDSREDRWSGGGGGGRWGGSGRGGPPGRWGRDRDNTRFDRPFQNQRGDYNSRDREYRGGGGGGDTYRGGPPPPPSHRGGGPPPPHAPPAPHGPHRHPPPPLPSNDRYSKDNRRPLDNRDKRPPHLQTQGGAGSWQRGGQIMGGNRGGQSNRGGGNPRNNNQKDGSNGNQNQQQQGWNQWAGGWGGWGNWNQNQQQAAAGWNNWQNWQNWNQAAGQQPPAPPTAGSTAVVAGGAGNKAVAQTAQQWPQNYTAQQWYQWQQWQQQQQNWAGYQQGQQQGNQATNAQDAQNAWAQYYQNYGNAAANAAGAVTGTDKKS